MKNIIFAMIVIALPVLVFGQDRNLQRAVDPGSNDQLGELNGDAVIKKGEKPPISDYKIISVAGDTTHVDTTLTVRKNYRFNYLRKDEFGLLPFSNVGRPYTRLTYTMEKPGLLPQFGARARHFNFLEVDDIYYYHVPTPFSELYFKTVFEQGQQLESFASVNISPQLNFFIGYKGLRSLGKYQHIMTSMGNFRTGLSYHSKDGRYDLKTHFVSQDLSSQENGGLTPEAVQQYENKDDEFSDRSLLGVRFQDAENLLLGKRFYLNHGFKLISGTDSLSNNELRVGHILNFTDKEFDFEQETASPWLGESYEDTRLRNNVEFQEIGNLAYVTFFNKAVGEVKLKTSYTNINYGYRTLLILDDEIVPNRIKDDVFAVGGAYSKKIGDFDVDLDAMINLSGNFEGNYFMGKMAYEFSDDMKAQVSLVQESRAPNYNFLLYQNDYKNYNWSNDFKNEQTQNLHFGFQSKKWGTLEARYTQITNHTYFGLVDNANPNSQADSLVKPMQYRGGIKFVKLKAAKEIELGPMALDNTILFQQVLDGEEVFHAPKFVTRNTLYYKDHWFKKALYLQTGVTLNYFSTFKANGYDPVLADFYVQNTQDLKGFATFDFFFNAKISQARIFFELENFTSIFTGNNNFSAPSYPYRDFAVRFGLVWDFFL